MPKVTDPAKIVTDPVALTFLQKQGKVADNWEFFQDYAARGVKEHSPYAKFYRNTDNLSERMMVVSGLPMVDCDGVKCEPQWIQAGTTYHIKNNVFSALVNDAPGRITLTCRNDQPDGVRKKNDRVVYNPQLFLNGVEIPRPSATLLPVDPLNPNYPENTLEWDYGVCKRHLRTVEGRIHGYWIFPANPGGEVRIVYNQTGQYRLRLGEFAIDDDTEVIPVSIFNSASYPFAVSDSATYNPDANPETTSVDGYTTRSTAPSNTTWADIHDGDGTSSLDTVSGARVTYINAGSASNTWRAIRRCNFLFDTSGLPDTATITAATLSIYGYDKNDSVITNDIAIYTSTPASNTALVAADYGQLGTVVQSDTITFANWSIVGYNDFTLNATGQGNISKTGVSKFGTRNASHDAPNSVPTWGSTNVSDLFGWFAEYGAGYKPKLVVTYSTATAPTVTVSAATSVAVTTATLNGNVTATGGENPTVTVYWGTSDGGQTPGSWGNSSAPTSPAQPQGVAAFTKDVTGLTSNTLYYFSAKATNSIGTDWPPASLSFTTGTAPTVTTQSVTAISGTTATGNGNITSLGTPTATQHGHCWNTTGTPTTADSKTLNGVPAATGAFTSAITALGAGTKYYVRAYATNTGGTSYGNEVTFWADKGTVAPTDTLTRVSGLSRQFWAGKGGNAVYDMQVTTGGISTTYIPPVGTRQEIAAVPQEHPTITQQAMAGLAGPGFQYADYVQWVNTRGPEWIRKTYGHIPLYQDWIKIMIDQFRTGAK